MTFCWCWDLNHRSLVSEATTLPTEPPPMHTMLHCLAVCSKSLFGHTLLLHSRHSLKLSIACRKKRFSGKSRSGRSHGARQLTTRRQAVIRMFTQSTPSSSSSSSLSSSSSSSSLPLQPLSSSLSLLSLSSLPSQSPSSNFNWKTYLNLICVNHLVLARMLIFDQAKRTRRNWDERILDYFLLMPRLKLIQHMWAVAGESCCHIVLGTVKRRENN